MAATYTPIASITLGANADSVTFSSIPQTYTDLILVAEAKLNTSTAELYCQINSDTGSNYSHTWLYGNGTSALSSRQTSQTQTRFNASNTLDATNFTNAICHFMNYSNTTTNKTIISRCNEAAEATVLTASLWRSTAAISTIKIYPSANNFASGSTFNLYGILGANA